MIKQFTRKRKDGSTYNRWGYDFFDDLGKRHRLMSCKTKGEAETAYKKAIKKMEKGQPIKDIKSLTFERLTELFLESHVKIHCALATQNKYKSSIKTHINPFFGKRRVIDIKMIDVNMFIAHLQEIKLAEKTINVTIGLLCGIFNFGIQSELITYNPCNKIRKLRCPYKEKNFLNEEHEVLPRIRTVF